MSHESEMGLTEMTRHRALELRKGLLVASRSFKHCADVELPASAHGNQSMTRVRIATLQNLVMSPRDESTSHKRAGLALWAEGPSASTQLQARCAFASPPRSLAASAQALLFPLLQKPSRGSCERFWHTSKEACFAQSILPRFIPSLSFTSA